MKADKVNVPIANNEKSGAEKCNGDKLPARCIAASDANDSDEDVNDERNLKA